MMYWRLCKYENKFSVYSLLTFKSLRISQTSGEIKTQGKSLFFQTRDIRQCSDPHLSHFTAGTQREVVSVWLQSRSGLFGERYLARGGNRTRDAEPTDSHSTFCALSVSGLVAEKDKKLLASNSSKSFYIYSISVL